MASGGALFLRSQFARSYSTLDKTYLSELGFGATGVGSQIFEASEAPNPDVAPG